MPFSDARRQSLRRKAGMPFAVSTSDTAGASTEHRTGTTGPGKAMSQARPLLRIPCRAILALALLAAGMAVGVRAGSADDAAEGFGGSILPAYQCPHAEVLCLQKVGYNYQKCGELTGMGGAVQEFPLCAASDANSCVPCWFGTVEDTRAHCIAAFGPDCRHFTAQNENWKGTWDDMDWPDLSPLYRLFDDGPD